MGKKRVVSKTKEELLEERAKVKSAVEDVKVKAPKKTKKGRLYISSSYNNTKINLTDEKGNTLYWTSTGKIGFKGTKKGTPFAASKVAEAMSQAVDKLKIKEVKVFVKGVGPGRDSALRSLAARGVNMVSIKDVTPIPHNGCRPRKPRRV